MSKEHDPFFADSHHWLPIDNPRHTEVLGYRVSTKHGKTYWDVLDWNHWRLDHTTTGHIFSDANCIYFHVRCKNDDPDSFYAGCTYRVRCFYAGGKYRGREVVGVNIGSRDGKLCWIVRTKAEGAKA